MKRSVPSELKPNYARFMTAMFSARARELGFEPRQDESDDDRILRSAEFVPAVAEIGDQELIAKAKELAWRWSGRPQVGKRRCGWQRLKRRGREWR